MIKCTFSLPDSAAGRLGIPQQELEPALKRELALSFFQRNVLSFGQAREWADSSVWEFLELLRTRGISIQYDLLELEEDLACIKDL